ncbi:MAG: oxidoreductase [Promethearchaeota archaeon]
MRKFSPLGDSCRVGNMIVQNRFLAQPLERNNARDDGTFSESLLESYRGMARGSWGLIVMETTAIKPDQKCRRHALVLADGAENDQSWTSFFKEMKGIGETGSETLWIVEISAAGSKNISGARKSLYKDQMGAKNIPVMTTGEIDELLDAYVHATRLAYERGSDGIDFKMCHGYFSSLFLRPNNRRDDGYGGSFKNRTRFLREYMKRARNEVGDKNFIWTTRMNGWDGAIPGGFGMAGPAGSGLEWVRDRSEVHELYKLLADLKFDLVNVSGGIPTPNGIIDPARSIPVNFTTFQELALDATSVLERDGRVVRVASAAWSALGPGIVEVANGYLSKGIDFVGIGRWQLCEPALPRMVLQDASNAGLDPGDYIEEESNVCIACGKCGAGLSGEGPVSCQIYQT